MFIPRAQAYTLTALVITLLSASPVRASDPMLEVQHQGNVSYVSGGVGSDERTELESTRSNYNLRILSSSTSGHLSGDVHVVVTDQHKREVLNTTGGPIIYAHLQDGRYTVEGFRGGESRKKLVNIMHGKSIPVRFIW
jgi:hypothetical protein